MLEDKKGPHWELNPGPLAIKARFSQSENHTTRPYGHNLFPIAKTHIYINISITSFRVGTVLVHAVVASQNFSPLDRVSVRRLR